VHWCGSLNTAYEFQEDRIAGFLSDLWSNGAAASRVKSSLSVLEVTKKVMFPTRPALLQNGLIRSLIDAVVVDKPVKRKGPDKGETPFYDPARISTYWSQQDDNATLPIERLRAKAISLLMMDLFLRSSDTMQFTFEETYFESGGMGQPDSKGLKTSKSVLFKVTGLKEHRSQKIRWSQFRVPCICNMFKGSCSCCTLQVYLHRSRVRRATVKKVVQITSDGEKRLVQPIWITHNKNKARALSKDALRNDLKKTMEASGIDTKYWTPHTLRGATTSKCLNIGLESNRVMEHGRWITWQTIKKHYYRIDFYEESSDSNKNLPIWQALRIPGTTVDVTKE